MNKEVPIYNFSWSSNLSNDILYVGIYKRDNLSNNRCNNNIDRKHYFIIHANIRIENGHDQHISKKMAFNLTSY